MRFHLIALPCAAALAALLLLSPASRAQALSPDAVRDCLCRERALDNMRQDVAEKRSAYDGARARLDAMEKEIASMRATMNPNDQLKVQLLAEQIEHRDQARTALQGSEYRALQASIAELNAAVAEYNRSCADRPMRKVDIDAAQRDLQCPTP